MGTGDGNRKGGSMGGRRRGGAAVKGRPPPATLSGNEVSEKRVQRCGCRGAGVEAGAEAGCIGGCVTLCIVLDILSSALSRSSALSLASRLRRSCCSSVSCSATQRCRSLTFDCAACSWPCSRAARSCSSRSSAIGGEPPSRSTRNANPKQTSPATSRSREEGKNGGTAPERNDVYYRLPFYVVLKRWSQPTTTRSTRCAVRTTDECGTAGWRRASGVPCEVGHAARRCVHCAEGLSMSVGSTFDGYEYQATVSPIKSYFHL